MLIMTFFGLFYVSNEKNKNKHYQRLFLYIEDYIDTGVGTETGPGSRDMKGRDPRFQKSIPVPRLGPKINANQCIDMINY